MGLTCKPVKGKFDKRADLRLVVRIAALQMPVGNGAADCSCLVAKMSCETGDSGAFHLEVGYPVAVEREGLEGVKHVRHCKSEAYDPALRPVEAGSRDGDTLDRAVLEAADQVFAGFYEIW